MRNRMMIITAMAVMGLLIGTAFAQDAPKVAEKPLSIEVVFCVDTTGSMGGLIEGAKAKIWGIVNEIVKQKPTPDIKIGLVAYRDRGDAYITQTFPLSTDLDAVYKNLLTFAAGGGGDMPEHVNQALDESLTKMTWTAGSDTLKVIYLVGDCPPHMDYNDGYDYKKTAENAVKQFIYINTVRCGNNADTGKYWQEIATLGEGKFFSIDATGGMTIVSTPMDKELVELGSKLTGTMVAYGDAGFLAKEEAEKMDSYAKGAVAAPGAPSSAAEAGAARAEAKGMAMDKAKSSAYDLIDAVSTGKVKLEDVKDEDLPEEMVKMSLEERKAFLAGKDKERKELQAKIEKLSRERAEYIAEEMKKKGADDKDSFDKVVIDNLKELMDKKAKK